MNETTKKSLGIALLLLGVLLLGGIGLHFTGISDGTIEEEQQTLELEEVNASYAEFYDEILGLLNEFVLFNENAALALDAYSENPTSNKEEYLNTLENAISLMEKATGMIPPSDLAGFYDSFAAEASSTADSLSDLKNAVENGEDFMEIAVTLSESSSNFSASSAELLNALFEKM